MTTRSAGLRVAYVAGWSPQRAPGLARYATELAAGLARVTVRSPQPVPTDVAHRPTAGGPDPIASLVEMVSVTTERAGAARLAWSQVPLPLRLSRLRPDVCHITAAPAPLAWRGPTVLTLHDLSLLRLPDAHPRGRVAVGVPLLRASVRRASQLIAPSRATAADAIALLRVHPDRVHVIPEAPAPWFRPVTDPTELDVVLRRHGLEPGYLLALGTREPRKNLAVVLQAVARLRAGGMPVRMVLAGSRGWGQDAVRRSTVSPTHDPVQLLGHVPDADLPGLLSAAGAVVHPSLLEGFGLPVVEALACGAPVVTSDRGATAEVAGDAALLVDPADPAALADAIATAITPGPTRDRLRALGPRHAATFDWDSAARATISVYALAAGASASATASA